MGRPIDSDVLHSGSNRLIPQYVAIDAAGSGDNTLVAAVGSRRVRALAAVLVSAGTVTVQFEDGAGGSALSGPIPLLATTGFTLPFNPVGWFETSLASLLNLALTDAIQVSGCLVYVEVP